MTAISGDRDRTGLPDVGPVSWAVRRGPLLVTAQMPIRPDGTFETGALEKQIDLALANLRRAIEAAGGSLADVVQVVTYFTSEIDRPLLNAVWERFFAPPWPSRSIVGVRELAVPGVLFHLTATAWVGE
jgi:enamine deaminase RidA (YjgF/YER057c/UK114 family)